ncbi:MAG: type II toxin-antitoxin system RelE/ParE family toxin [Bacteroidetes bacterium]|nr:type II toxin-antitoxin system RelE/ParE family toxin [Bacteroidota bacterium]
MKVEVQRSFEKDIEKVTDAKLAAQISAVIDELENCKSLSGLRHLKRMQTKGSYYRIRIGNYRLGLLQDKDKLILLRFMHRKDIYNYFP